MNVAVYLYDGYYETELCIPTMLFSEQNLFTFSIDQEIVKCMDGRRSLVDKQIKDVNPEDIDVLIIPGGKPVPREEILEFIVKCEKHGAIIGGICGGVYYMAFAGILNNRRFTCFKEKDNNYDFHLESGIMTDSMYESDRKVVSAKPEAYLEFALELYRLAGLLNPDDIEGYLEWFKSPTVFK